MGALRTTAAIATAWLFAPQAFAVATFVAGPVPDWDQPYAYGPPIGVGPGPDPMPGAFSAFDAWCAPTAAANLIGHWEDALGEPIGDGMPFPLTPPYGPPPWHDYQLDMGRPPAGPPPAMVTDVAWYMDTNDSGDAVYGNPFHVGTFVENTHAGLATFLNTISSSWRTGTRAVSFGLGTESSGAPAMPHLSAASAFAEVMAEIDAGRTLLITWQHWDVLASGVLLGGDPSKEFYTFDPAPGSDPWGNDEDWDIPVDPKRTLGHVVTAVGYIAAGDPDDPGRDAMGMVGGPVTTDWVIVRDNVPATPIDVIVPLTAMEYPAPWVANTNAIRDASVPALGLWGGLLIAGALLAIGRLRLAGAR